MKIKFSIPLFIIIFLQCTTVCKLQISWSKQLGIKDMSAFTTDPKNNLIILGDDLIAKFDSAGNKIWANQYDSKKGGFSRAITTDSNDNIFVPFSFWDSGINKQTDFLGKFDSSGNNLWTKELAYKYPVTCSTFTDFNNNLYIAGYGNLDKSINSNEADAYLIKFGPSGETLWTRQFGTDSYEYIFSATTDLNNNIYIAGSSAGSFEGYFNTGAGNHFSLTTLIYNIIS